MPGATVPLDAGPRAAERLQEVPGLAVEPAGEGPRGFARLRIAL